MTRFWIALNFVVKCGLWPRTAWNVAGTCLEMREFCRKHGVRRDGAWLEQEKESAEKSERTYRAGFEHVGEHREGGKVSLSKLGFDYRPDGNFLLARKCRHCGEEWYVHAMAPMTPESAYGLCPVCEAVRQMEIDARD